MKHRFLYLFLIFTLLACKNDDDNTNGDPLSQLPTETQTGENTFGCLLDGEPFIPGGGINPLDCVYQFVNGGYYFSVQGSNIDGDNFGRRISIGTENLELSEGSTYQLLEEEDGKANGTFFYSTLKSDTSINNSGELTITKLDTENQIISGTFWFDVIHPYTNEIAKIREGRFDMQYSR
ncbi:DUF6252 family protein [Leeuwenhoekiella parthenopeia]|uniref:DUF6252 family protein n=1 Tax=Leeuwenhoekiella parthenopeia TaxID=2890320 RepID=A0ABS8GXF6_9FLAO|nr:DUF6252 family protein [Leeuwenhoekiella parthenopeia]MCC4213877.1 DUF6252 family protein [Leeuwenhoekiella parthenopeia]